MKTYKILEALLYVGAFAAVMVGGLLTIWFLALLRDANNLRRRDR